MCDNIYTPTGSHQRVLVSKLCTFIEVHIFYRNSKYTVCPCIFSTFLNDSHKESCDTMPMAGITAKDMLDHYERKFRFLMDTPPDAVTARVLQPAM